MVALYVTEPLATVRREHERFLVTVDERSPPGPPRRRTLLAVPPHQLDLVALFGRVHITLQATWTCLESGIAVAWFSSQGQLRGRLTPPANRSAEIRLKQYARWSDPQARLEAARRVVAAKLANAAAFLVDIQSNYPGNSCLAANLARVKELASHIPVACIPEQLLGMEGAATRAYFEGYATGFRQEIRFTTRHRRPPPDPANALLSLGYVLLGERLAGLIEAHGLDPGLGFLHAPQAGRASLALDLLEELRHPVVDRFVLRVTNLKVLQPAQFEPDPDRGGVRLTRAGLQRFLEQWERFLLRPLREHGSHDKHHTLAIVRRQVERLAADLRGGGPYVPFRYGT